MAFIEPRLIHLLNEAITPQLPHNDLPPLRTLTLTNTDRPLPPLEPDAIPRGERPRPEDPQLVNDQASTPHPLPEESSINTQKDSGLIERNGKFTGPPAAMPLSLLLGETEAAESTQSPNKTTDDTTDTLDDGGNKKRHLSLLVKDDFMPLPQPVKKQKATRQAPAFPPMINGLHEPPPHAALVPSISRTFGTGEKAQLNFGHAFNTDFSPFDIDISALQPHEFDIASNHVFEEKTISQPSSEADKDSNRLPPDSSAETEKQDAQAKKRAIKKKRRKWSEEETNHLLLGVSRYGMGKWTSILEDPEFKFDARTAGDLKDRFRTCCPDDFRTSTKGLRSGSPPASSDPIPRLPKEDHLGKILIDSEEPPMVFMHDTGHEMRSIIESRTKPRKSRAHRKKLEDLASLGIIAPFKKSHRRERRPFTEQDDREILEGLDQYGPAWTKIHRDKRFHLSSRQPTDLRDRVRNKYPEIYAGIEKGTLQDKDAGRSADTLEPPVNRAIEPAPPPVTSSTLDPKTDSSPSRAEFPKRPILHTLEMAENPQPSHSFEFGEMSGPPFTGSEMDLSRLLLDDKTQHATTRLAIEGVSGSSSPASATHFSREDPIKGLDIHDQMTGGPPRHLGG